MKEIAFTQALAEVIEEALRALDEVIKEDVEVLADIGNPEKLIGKPYEQWTEQDKMMLGQVYGNDPKLSNFVFNKEYANLKKLEEEL